MGVIAITGPEEIIQLNGVTKSYGRHLALDNITLSIGSGITGLLGPNGSGKSTMIKSLLGLLRIQAGEAQVLGYSLPAGIRQIRDHVGYLPEDDCFIAGLSGIESVRFMAELSGLPGIEALRRSHEAMDFADIAQERYRNVETYSTGMRQKLKFAQSIVHDPKLLILDEPTSGLDPEQRTSMLRKIKNLAVRHGKSILISTHILHDVRTVCDQVVIMSQGKIRIVDSLENLSRPSRAGMSVRVLHDLTGTLEEPYPEAQRLLDCLAKHNVRGEVRARGDVWVDGLGSEDCDVIWAAAHDAGVYVQQLQPAKNSLEEVFFNAVKEAEHASA